MTGLYVEDSEPGLVIRHALSRTVTETDNLLITTLTHNPQPLHLDAEAAKDTEFGRILVNSMFTFALMVGLSVGDTTMGTLVANLGFDAVVFPKPVFIGDTLRAETTILERRESRSRPTQGVVVYEHRCLNQKDEIVVQCRRTTLVKKRPLEERS
jgi:acyl dehydratase